MHEFYANLSENVDVVESLEFEKAYVCGHVYEFSPKAICKYLKIPMYSFNEFDKNIQHGWCCIRATYDKVFLAQE